ncbi:MAG TPA: two-component regulator propeller domain-containing protein [Saprospiraceae bacterium]|nr:two-component regulator propeller domain-containing protein [Saprospiraceae bacterium]
MHEDHLGYIWLGTNEGLYRFDGVHYKLYTGKDKYNSLGREVISSIYEDNQNNLWIGARSGLYRYDKHNGDFDKFSFGDELYAYYIHQENDSCFLIHSIKGLYLCYPKTNRWQKLDVSLNDNKIYTVLRGKSNDVWIGTDDLVRKYDLNEKVYHDYEFSRPAFAEASDKISANSMFMDSYDQLWINTWFRGVIKFDTRTGSSTLFDTIKSGSFDFLLGMYNPSMAEDANGDVWLATENRGINIYHQSTGTFTHILKGSDYSSGLLGSYFFIMSDRKKNMWIKSDHVLHYLSRNSPVTELLTDQKQYIPDALFIKFITTGYALIGTHFGLYGIDLNNNNVNNLSSTIDLPVVHNAEMQSSSDALIYKDGNLLFATPQGLRHVHYSVDADHKPLFNFKKLYTTKPTFWPSKLMPLNDSIVIIKGRSNTRTFALFNINSGIFNYHEFPDSMLINQIIKHTADTLIIGIRNKGLFYYKISGKGLQRIPWNFELNDIAVIRPVFLKITSLDNGNYAVCTENYGMMIYNPVKKLFQHIDVAPLANTNAVYSCEEDRQHNLWIQTSTQLLFYDIKQDRLSKINLSDSFKGENPAYFMEDDNEIYCTFEGGLYRIDPTQLFTKTEKPKLYLESIKAGEQQLDLNSSDQIQLKYSENSLSYQFIGLDFENPQGVSYWYKIPEINEQWVPLQNQTSLNTGRLAPGNYHFIVKASNDAGLWSDDILAPPIKITPPFWSTWWFVLILAIIAASLTAYFLKLRRMKSEAELKLRNQIARDLHDDIGSTLSGIKIFSSIASDLAKGDSQLSPLLQQINDKSDTMMQSMSDIVWSINPTNDSLHDIVIRLKQYMSEMLESQNIEVQFSTQIDLKSYKFDLQHRKELYLALKEIINNAAKHAECQKVIFDISRNKGEIIFLIKDDGIGMSENNIVLGNGLRNVEARIRQIEGKVIRESSPGNGTSYEIRVGTI